VHDASDAQDRERCGNGHSRRTDSSEKRRAPRAVARGPLTGQHVLDLGCNAEFWSLAAAQAEFDFVLDVDGRQMHVDQANLVSEVGGIEDNNYDFVEGDVFALDLREFGRFDI
jgi:23S rRNA G2069 N7-methylase RlmK/C1962 C5-methylase RlmI